MPTMNHFVSEDQRDTLVGALRKGMSLKVACQIARVPHGRMKALLAEAEELAENPNFVMHELDIVSMEMVEFYFQVQEANGRREETWVGYMMDAAKNDWRAAQALLKARNPEDWSENTKVQVENTTNRSQTQLDLSQLSVAELEVLEKLMMKLGSSGSNKQLVQTGPDRVVLVANEK